MESYSIPVPPECCLGLKYLRNHFLPFFSLHTLTTPAYTTRQPYRWLPCKDLAFPANILPQVKITLHSPSTNHPTPPRTSPVASSNCPGSRFTATIPHSDSQSFVTDYPQSWLTQPQSPRHPTPAPVSTTSTTPDLVNDFVLFPDPSPALPRSERAPATCHTDPNYSGTSFTGQRQLQTQQINPVSSLPQRRVSNNYLPRNSSVSSSNGLHPGSYSLTRPPVPLFANKSSRTINQRPQPASMSINIPQPNSPTTDPQSSPELFSSDLSSPELTSPSEMSEFLDYTQAADATGLLAMEDNVMDSPYTFDMGNDLTRQTSNSGFVSPQDLYCDSAPPSTTFTDISTPRDFFESPNGLHFADDDDSPLFDHDDGDSFEFETMSMFPPLYPSKPRVEQSVTPSLNESYSIESSVATATPLEAPAMSRNASSPGKTLTRSSQQGRPTGVTKSKRRATKELDPIHVHDPNNPVEVKRARNTAAARKSRNRRAGYIEDLENENVHLVSEVDNLRAELAHAHSILDRHGLSP